MRIPKFIIFTLVMAVLILVVGSFLAGLQTQRIIDIRKQYKMQTR